MQNEPYEQDTSQPVADNYANKRCRSAACDVIRPLFTACSLLTDKKLTPEQFIEVFEQLGIAAGEEGQPASRTPFRRPNDLAQFGKVLQSAWETGHAAGFTTHKANRRKAP